MANRQLTPEELKHANALLDEIRIRLETLSAGDKNLLFAYRRKIFKELTYDERSKPMARRKLKEQNMEGTARALCNLRKRLTRQICCTRPNKRSRWLHQGEYAPHPPRVRYSSTSIKGIRLTFHRYSIDSLSNKKVSDLTQLLVFISSPIPVFPTIFPSNDLLFQMCTNTPTYCYAHQGFHLRFGEISRKSNT